HPRVGPADDDAAPRGGGARRGTGDARPRHPRALHVAGDRPAARRARELRAGAPVRLARGESRARHSRRLGEGAEGTGRPAPADLRAEMSRASSLGHQVWVHARAENNFASFLPVLRQNLELRRRYIDCFEGDYDEPYDAALDDYERGMKTAEVRAIFEYLKEN